MSNTLTEGDKRGRIGRVLGKTRPKDPPPSMIPENPPNEGSSGIKPKTVEVISIRLTADTKEVEAALLRLSEFADELRDKFESLMRDVELASKTVQEFTGQVKSDE